LYSVYFFEKKYQVCLQKNVKTVAVGGGGSGYGKMSPDTILPPPWRHRQDKKILQPLRCVWRPLFND